MNSNVRKRQQGGFTLVEIMVVVAIVALLATLAIPNYVKARDQARKQTCINNLKKMDEAKHLWGLDAKKDHDDVPTEAEIYGFDAYIKTKPTCPSSGSYDLLAIGVFSTCTFEGHSLGGE